MNYPDGITADDLPDVIADFAEQFGFQVAMLIVEKYSNRHLRVPTKKRSPDLVSNLGDEITDKLIQIYGGCQWLIPRCKSLEVKIRNIEIVAYHKGLIESGISQSNALLQCARKWDLTYAHISEITKRYHD